MQTCDVLIVGGGPAGSSCARELVRAGLDAVVMDARRFPRDKICAGWITPQVLETLAIAPVEYAVGRVLQPITGFAVGTLPDLGGISGRRRSPGPVEIRFGRVVSYGILRREFDHFLLERSGARLVLGERARTFEESGGAWIVNGRFKAPMLVGAGGHFCPVAQRFGGGSGRETALVVAQELEVPLPAGCPISGDTPELLFCADLKGYGWCFRKGDHLNLGLGREDRERLPEHVRAFLASRRAAGRIADLPAAPAGHAYLLHRGPGREAVGDRVLLVGDAAGLAYPQSGEGIRTAVESGILAARAIAQAGPGYLCPRLEPYRAALRDRFGSRDPGAGTALPAPLLSAVGRILLGNPWFARHVVLDRWFLHATTPAMG